jgi:hypothetical protein
MKSDEPEMGAKSLSLGFMPIIFQHNQSPQMGLKGSVNLLALSIRMRDDVRGNLPAYRQASPSFLYGHKFRMMVHPNTD